MHMLKNQNDNGLNGCKQETSMFMLLPDDGGIFNSFYSLLEINVQKPFKIGMHPCTLTPGYLLTSNLFQCKICCNLIFKG